jgi:hypothetical protein
MHSISKYFIKLKFLSAGRLEYLWNPLKYDLIFCVADFHMVFWLELMFLLPFCGNVTERIWKNTFKTATNEIVQLELCFFENILGVSCIN